MNTHALTRRCRALTSTADQLHPVALLVLVPLLVGLVYLAAPAVIPALVALMIALVTTVKAVVTVAGAAVLARLAYRAAVHVTARRAVISE